MGAGHRLAVRPGFHRHVRHRQRHRPRYRRVPALHPDGRGGQPGQLRRSADQSRWRSGRHQLADHLAQRRLHGHFAGDPHRRGHARGRPAARHRQGDPWPRRRADRRGWQGCGRGHRPAQGRRRPGQQRRGGRSGRQGRRAAGRRDPEVQRRNHQALVRSAAHRRRNQAGYERRPEVWRKGKTITLPVKVGEIPAEKGGGAKKGAAPPRM